MKAKGHYILGKILYAENSYTKAMKEFEKITSEEGVNKGRVAKAWLNMALVKCMSSNYKQMLEMAEKATVYIEANDKLLKFKYMIKKATLLKKSSWFREGFDLLKQLEKEVSEYIDQLESQESAENNKLAFKAKTFLYKTVRDLARMSYLLKDNQ